MLSAIKYLEHIINSNNTLVYKVYKNTEQNNSWVKIVKDWIDKLGFSYLNSDQSSLKFSIKTKAHQLVWIKSAKIWP